MRVTNNVFTLDRFSNLFNEFPAKNFEVQLYGND